MTDTRHVSLLVLLAVACGDTSALATPPSSGGRTPVVRRLGQVAKLAPDRVKEFTRIARQSDDVARAFAEHGIAQQLVYVKELAANETWAFCYEEYRGTRLIDDQTALAQVPAVVAQQKALDACLVGGWVDVVEVFHTAGRTESTNSGTHVQRFGQVVGIRPEMIPPYKLLHAHAWPEVLGKIAEGNIRNYSIYLGGDDEKSLLFAYFEYVGSDFAGDMQRIDGDAATQAWMKFTDHACQLPIPTRAKGEWWANMQEVSVLPAGGGDAN